MKALVTGCAGFIGSNLVDKLIALGYEVVGIDCFTDYYPGRIKEANIVKALSHRGFKLIKKDISNMNKFPEVDFVFHLAAQAGVRFSWGKNFEIYLRHNIQATQRLLEFYKSSQIKKLIYASSSSVYGDAELPMKEDSILKPVSPYGVTKVAAENLCYLYWKNYGVPVTPLRYFTVYGPRQRPDMAINKFVKAILEGEEVTIYDHGKQTRDFTYVDDIVDATILASQSQFEGKIFNIGGGSAISVNDLIMILENIIGKRVKRKNIEKQRGDVGNTLADTSIAKDLLGWKPKTSINVGAGKYVKWYIETSPIEI